MPGQAPGPAAGRRGTEQAQDAGAAASLWRGTAPITGYPALAGDVETDVAVVGGGIAGLTAALALRRRGFTVVLLEAARIGTGVTGNTAGKVASLHRLAYTELAATHGPDAARAYGEANETAIEHIAATVQAEGIDCGFRRVANYTGAESEEALASVRAEAGLTRELGLPASYTTDVPSAVPGQGCGPLRLSQREVLGRFASGIVVVTAISSTGPVGFTCQSFASLSLNPALVSFSPSRTSTTWPRIREAENFCINILAEGHQQLSNAFARTGTDKFANVSWTPAPSGAPILDGVIAWADCSLWAEYDGGDHTIVATKVHSLNVGHDAHPLLFYRGSYGLVQPDHFKALS